MAPKYSEVLPSEVDTSTKLSSNLTLKIPLLSSAMDTVTESKMAIAIARAGGIGVIHRNLDIKKQINEIKKVKKLGLLVGAAVGAGPLELKRAEAILKQQVDLIVVDTAHGHSKKVAEIIKAIKKIKTNKTTLCAGNIATTEAAKFLIKLGVDIVKVGIGPGSICTTRLVAGIGKDLGENGAIYENAEVLEFCSALYSRRMAEFSPTLLAFCPYAISVYTLYGEPYTTYVAFKLIARNVADDATREVLQQIDDLLKTIVEEASL